MEILIMKNLLKYLGIITLLTASTFAQMSQPPRWGQIQGSVNDQSDLTNNIKTTVNIATQSVMNDVKSYIPTVVTTNLAGGYRDAFQTNYVITPAPTVTILRAWGDTLTLSATTNTTLTFHSDFLQSNAVWCLALSYHPNGFSTTFDPSCISTNGATNTIPGSTSLAIQTNSWNLIVFCKAFGWTNIAVRQ